MKPVFSSRSRDGGSSSSTYGSSRRWRRTRGLIGATCALAVALGGGGSLSASASPGAVGSGPAKSASVLSLRAVHQVALASARSLAQSTGEPVVVDALTSPTEQTRAMPDGSMQLEVSTVPVRVERDGEWIPVDTALARIGDWLEPVASAAPVRFSPGGSNELAQVQTESGAWITETWPYGTLPAPVVVGDTATYPDVLPDVDLKMVATKTGQASIYVVKTEKAAQSAKLEDLHVIIEEANLTKKTNGLVEAEAGDGSGIVAGQPLWWDSSDGGTYRESGDEKPPAPVTHEISTDRVAMDVGDSVVKEEKRSGDDIEYPIFVDPDWSSGIAASWYTDAAYPNQSYLSAGASDVLRVGIYQHYRSDMFFQFPIGALAGKIVTSAVLNTTQLSVNACGTLGAIQIHTYGPKPAGFTWNQEQSWNAAGTGGWSGAMQSWVGPGCGSPAMPVGWNVTSGVQAKVGQSDVQFAITYSNPSAPSRRHFSRAATLIVSYNTRPNVPTSPTFTSPSAPCGTQAAPTLIGQKDVTVQVHQTDPDSGNVDTNFHLMRASNLAAAIQNKAGGLGAQGNKSVTFTGLADDTYAWRAWGSDWMHDGVGPSAWCYFTVDTVGPQNPPEVSVAPGPYVVGATRTVSFVTDPSDKVAFVAFAVVPGAQTDSFVFDVFAGKPKCSQSYGIVRISCSGSASNFTPTATTSTIWAVSYDAAGNPMSIPGKPATEAGKYGVGVTINAANHSAVSYAKGHVWRTLAQSSPLPDQVPGTRAVAPVPLTLGADTVRTLSANPIAPDVPLLKPVLGFVQPSSGSSHTSAATTDMSLHGSFTLAAWLKPGVGGGSTALSIGPNGTVELGASAHHWRFCYRTMALAEGCLETPRSPSAGWTHLAIVRDSSNSQIRLYVDGALAAIAQNVSFDAGAASTNTFDVGVTLVNQVAADRWTGQIADPAWFGTVATASQLIALRAGQDPANG